MTELRCRVLIVGAGVCGLACAWELEALGCGDWLVLEAADRPGGLAASVRDERGFLWDQGGHVVFGESGEFDRLLDDVLAGDWNELRRTSAIWFDGWVPYPFQSHLHHLPPEVGEECLGGLADAPGGRPDMDYETWIVAQFGPGIARHFMLPYNAKVWSHPLRDLSPRWVADRVQLVRYRDARRAFGTGDDGGAGRWGPNDTFRYPRRGGTGEIFRRLAARYENRIVYGRQVVSIDAGGRVATTRDGVRVRFDRLLSTMPLDALLSAVQPCPATVRLAASRLVANRVAVVGVGAAEPTRDALCWAYFPQAWAPFYRVTNLGRYSSDVLPSGDPTRESALMAEVSLTSGTSPAPDLPDRVVAALVRTGLVHDPGSVLGVTVIDVLRAYPVPTLDRDTALRAAIPWLEAAGIHTRGRFGSWTYELGNMDHAVMMGVDFARAIVCGERERALDRLPGG